MATLENRSRAQPAVSDAEWACLERDGFLRLGRTLSDAELSALQGRIDDIMLGRVRDDGLMMQQDLGGDYGTMAPMTLGFKGASLSYRKIENLERDQLFRTFLVHHRFRGICARAYGPERDIAVYRAMFMNKPAQQGTLLPWHQDGGAIWGLDRDPLVTVWTALDPATRANGCVQVVPGSHRLGLLSAFGHTISAHQEARHCAQEGVLHLELDAGESVLLHNWTLHRSDVNRTNAARRAFSVCYMDAETRVRASGARFQSMFSTTAP